MDAIRVACPVSVAGCEAEDGCLEIVEDVRNGWDAEGLLPWTDRTAVADFARFPWTIAQEKVICADEVVCKV